MNPVNSIELVEFEPLKIPIDALSYDIGQYLWRNYKPQIDIEFPSPKTDNCWELTSQGWVGCIPVNDKLRIILKPKVNKIDNIFRMLEYAYALKSFKYLDGCYDCSNIEEFYDRLAHLVSMQILRRGRKGFYRGYVAQEAKLPFVTGQINIRNRIKKPWDPQIECKYQEHTADLEDNQILAWTLYIIARSGFCSDRTIPSVNKAFRELQSLTNLRNFNGQVCVRRLYNRLNDDYQPMHLLCRFFLDHTGPVLDSGEERMLPFLVSMDNLFELFVAEWLKIHLPKEYYLKSQENIEISDDGLVHFTIDLVLYDNNSNPVCVLDTKYKVSKTPYSGDIMQASAYALSKGCKDAYLIYPEPISRALLSKIGDIRVSCLSFDIRSDLEISGQKFLKELLN